MSLYSLMITTFAVFFWIFRVMVALTTTLNMEFFLKPLDVDAEIVLAFITLFCLIFICRRNLIAALVYLISHFGYFGIYTYNVISSILADEEIVTVQAYLNLLFSIIGIIIPLLIFIDIGTSKSSKKTSNRIKKTDWFYQEEQYDRKFDERADRNQYKF